MSVSKLIERPRDINTVTLHELMRYNGDDFHNKAERSKFRVKQTSIND